MHRLARACLDHPRTALVIIAAVTCFLGLGVPRVKNEFGYRVLIGDDHPSIVRLDAFIERFGGGLPVMVAWECGPGFPCEHALDERSLAVAESITSGALELPSVRAVTGPANAAILASTPDGFAVRRLIEHGEVPDDIEVLRKLALEDSLWRDRLIEADGSSAVVHIQALDTESETGAALLDALDDILAPHRAAGYDFKLIGDFVGSVIGGRLLAESTGRMIPALVAVIGLILFAFSRSWRYSLVALATMGVALLWTTGLMGWLGWPQDGIHEVLAPLILVVGVCDAVHILSRNAAGSEDSRKPRDRILSAAEEVGPACAITTATTAVAFASFTTSNLDSFFRFGLISAFGVSACLVLSFSVLPILAVWLPDSTRIQARADRFWTSALTSIVQTAQRQSSRILVLSLLLLVIGAAGWAQLRADNDWIEGFGRESDLSQWMQFADETYGTDTVEVEMQPPLGQNLASLDSLDRIRALGEQLAKAPEFYRPSSFVNYIETLNRALHGGDSDYARIADSEKANSELIELVAFDDPNSLTAWVSLDRRAARLSLKADAVPFSRKIELMTTVDAALSELRSAGWTVSATGTLPINHDWVRDVQRTQLSSFPVAFGLVLVIVSLHLRSLGLGVAAMIPTLVPVVLTLGAMGWVGLTLDVGRAMVAAIMIGIGVDDSIHFLGAYRLSRRTGHGTSKAIQQSIESTGRAIVTTSFGLALGFLTLMGSAWQTISSFGFFASLTIASALVATLFMLPALLYTFDREEK